MQCVGVHSHAAVGVSVLFGTGAAPISIGVGVQVNVSRGLDEVMLQSDGSARPKVQYICFATCSVWETYRFVF